jgi:hypothetical protein
MHVARATLTLCALSPLLARRATQCHADGTPCFTEQAMAFQEKILRTSCIGECSIFPPSIFSDAAIANPRMQERERLRMGGAREEAELMMFRAVERVLTATKTDAKAVDILVGKGRKRAGRVPCYSPALCVAATRFVICTNARAASEW